MYAGSLTSTQYLTVANHNLFYWLFRNPSRQASDPFVIWINGGPGASSMFGLFGENGPLRVTRTGAGPDDFVMGLNPAGSWADVGDILFIDQPVGTGFSFTSDVQQTYVGTMQEAGDEFLFFLRNFMAMHPDYA
jgi:carboxypeptidase C (cathepsin A)